MQCYLYRLCSRPSTDEHTHFSDWCRLQSMRPVNSERHWNCIAHFRYHGSIEYHDTWGGGIVIVAPISGIAQHQLNCDTATGTQRGDARGSFTRLRDVPSWLLQRRVLAGASKTSTNFNEWWMLQPAFWQAPENLTTLWHSWCMTIIIYIASLFRSAERDLCRHHWNYVRPVAHRRYNERERKLSCAYTALIFMIFAEPSSLHVGALCE